VCIAALSCGRQTPTRPSQPDRLQLLATMWHEGDVWAYSLADRPDDLAIRVVRIAVRDPGSGQRQFLTYAQAVATLSDDVMVTAVSVWRIVPRRQGDSPQTLGEMGIKDSEFAGRLDGDATDPEPILKPKPSPCGGCCDDYWISMGCLKCCYR
jgi:hypothetical protein